MYKELTTGLNSRESSSAVFLVNPNCPNNQSSLLKPYNSFSIEMMVLMGFGVFDIPLILALRILGLGIRL